MKTCLLLKSGRTACRSEKFELFLVHNFHFPWLNFSPIHYFLWFLLFEIQPAGFIQGSQPSLGSHFHLITKLQNFTTTANVEGEISNSTNIKKIFNKITKFYHHRQRRGESHIVQAKNLCNIEGEPHKEETTNLQRKYTGKFDNGDFDNTDLSNSAEQLILHFAS